MLFNNYFSPRFELPAVQDMQPKEGKKVMITCHFCGEGGHKAIYCNKMPPDVREAQVRQELEGGGPHQAHYHMNMHNGPPPRGPQKPLEEVTCYKCGTKGHYANKCPKGHLAFLSHAGATASGGGAGAGGPPPSAVAATGNSNSGTAPSTGANQNSGYRR